MSDKGIKSISSIQELNVLLEAENKNPSDGLFLFKHSHRCFISISAKRRLQSELDQIRLPIYEVNVIESRDVSNAIAELSGIQHESPQLLLYLGGKWIGAISHARVDAQNAQHILDEAV
jgi:bacillithiol system protein YtxJ